MKKSLLIIALVAFGISANAQKKIATKDINLPKDLSAVKVERNASVESLSSPAKVRNITRLATEDNGIYGEWISTQLDTRGESYGAQKVTLEKVNEVDEDGTVFNVLMKNFWMDGTEAYGIYDEAAGTLTFPSQIVATSTKELGYSNEYGSLLLITITAEDEVSEDPLVLVKDETGAFVLSETLSAYYIYAVDYVDQETGETGAGWDYAFELTLQPINGYMDFATTSTRFQVEEVDGWGDGMNDINYQDYETNIIINGFLGMGVVSIDINDDGTCTMQLKQTLGTDYYGEDYKYMRLIGVSDDPDKPGYILIDEAKESSNGDIFRNVTLQGGVEADVIRFFGVNDQNQYTYNEYFYGGSTPDADGRWYTLGGFFCAFEFVLFHNAQDGIEEVGMTREEKIKSTKTYNIMGQQVDRSTAKGLLIRDGKKYIAK